jgi:hypothetical protein
VTPRRGASLAIRRARPEHLVRDAEEFRAELSIEATPFV